MDEKMNSLDEESVVEDLLAIYDDESREEAFAETATTYENPADNDDGNEAASSLQQCAALCTNVGKEEVGYRPYFEFNGPLEFNDESMDDIIGKEQAKEELFSTLIIPTELKERPWTRFGNTILLFGLPGVGKTQLVCAALKASKYPYVWVNKNTVNLKWRGRACELMSMLFAEATKYKTCVIVLDGIDSMTAKKKKGSDGGGSNEAKLLTDTLCGLLDEARISKNIIVVAIAHNPNLLDKELRHNFPQIICVPLPVKTAERVQLFKQFISKCNHNIRDEALLEMAHRTNGYTGYDIHRAVELALRSLQREIIKNGKNEANILQESHLMDAVRMTAPTNGSYAMGQYLWSEMKYAQRAPRQDETCHIM